MTTDRPADPSENGAREAAPPRISPGLGRTLLWLGLSTAVVSTAVTLVVLRAVAVNRRPPPDETAERIQALIDEANRLLKKIDETR